MIADRARDDAVEEQKTWEYLLAYEQMLAEIRGSGMTPPTFSEFCYSEIKAERQRSAYRNFALAQLVEA